MTSSRPPSTWASSDRADLVAPGAVHRHFGSRQPLSTLIGVAALGYSDQLVEVEAIAARAERAETRHGRQ
jgi:enamine deaminase RidA (YjgF/YER057c/UK114 family)